MARLAKSENQEWKAHGPANAIWWSQPVERDRKLIISTLQVWQIGRGNPDIKAEEGELAGTVDWPRTDESSGDQAIAFSADESRRQKKRYRNRAD